MVKIEADGPERRSCVKRRRRTNHYVEYGYKNGPSVRIPVCPECKDIACGCLNWQMDATLKSVFAAVLASIIIDYDEKALRGERGDL